MIKVEDLTLTYPSGKGIFNVDSPKLQRRD